MKPVERLRGRAPAAAHGGRRKVVPIMDDMNAAAEARRKRIEMRVYDSLGAHDRDDARFWNAIPVGDRVLQVWQLSESQWRLRGEFPDESGLPRPVVRVHRP